MDKFEQWAEDALGLPTHKLASGGYQSFGMACAVKAWDALAQQLAASQARVLELQEANEDLKAEISELCAAHGINRGV